jgi:hypothetical protein
MPDARQRMFGLKKKGEREKGNEGKGKPLE